MLTGWIIGCDLNPMTGKNQVFEVGANGHDKKYLTPETDNCITPSWRPGGGYVYVKVDNTNTPWIMNSDGKAITVGLHPAYSPDGKVIVYTTLPTGRAQSEIAVINTDGAGRKVLTNTTRPDRVGLMQSGYGTFSPDGERIVYASSQSGSLQIWTMRADGSEQRALTAGERDANAPCWMKDGSRIAYFCGKQHDRGTIYVHDGTAARQLLVTGPIDNSDNPCSSPDGVGVAFESSRVVPGDIVLDPRTHKTRTWFMRLDGTGLRIMLPYGYGAGRDAWR